MEANTEDVVAHLAGGSSRSAPTRGMEIHTAAANNAGILQREARRRGQHDGKILVPVLGLRISNPVVLAVTFLPVL